MFSDFFGVSKFIRIPVYINGGRRKKANWRNWSPKGQNQKLEVSR